MIHSVIISQKYASRGVPVMSAVDQLKPFMEPESVALIGVTRYTGLMAFNILENLLSCGYQGKVYPVNPNASEILGIKCYPTIREVPGKVDLAVISTPRTLVPSILEDCVAKGIKSIVVVGQGFADANDEEGKQLQEKIVRIARHGGARIVGPNTFGTANAYINFHSAFAGIEIEKVPIGLICQSGTFFTGFARRKLVGKGIDLGNGCDIDFADGLEYFESDPQVELIALHIEGIRDGKRFLEVARRVARKKPILVLKTGKTDLAVKAVQSHTGSLVGKDEIWESAFKQCGVIRVSDIDELVDLSKTFLYLPLIKNKRVGVATFTGAVGVIALDACRQYNLEMAELSPQTRAKIGAMSPPWLNIDNPVDIWPAIMTANIPLLEALREGYEALLADPGVDIVLLIIGAYPREIVTKLSRLILGVVDAFEEKPVVCCAYGPYAQELSEELEQSGKTVVFPSPERAARALARLAQYSEFRQRESL